MNIKYPFLILFVALFISACSDSFLDASNPNQITNKEFWETEEDLKSGIATIYNIITDDYMGHYGTVNWELMASRTENFNQRNDIRSRYEISMFQNTFSNSNSSQLYNGAYIGIFRANQVIQNGEQMDLSADVKDPLIAEAKFLRGLNYFFLVTDFGSVPITTAVAETEEDYFISKSPKEEVWGQVVRDLKAGVDHLPEEWNATNKGRATKGAALGYLGRAYLYQAKYDSAIVALEQIVNNEGSFGYGLQENYAELFDGEHENGIESVFEIQYSNIGGTEIWAGNEANKPQTTFIAQELAPGEVGGWFEMRPTQTLLDAFLEESTASGDVDPRAYATMAWDYPGATHYQKDFSSTWGPDELWVRKNQNWWNADEGDWKSELNEYGMRYADVLLMLAEAYTMTGQVGQAVPLVHRIRDRANLADIQTQMNGYTQEQMMAEIRHQRNLEFAREGLRFYDLRRWDLLESTIENAQERGYQNYSSKYEYYPIPENELNNNPNITQNDPWK